MKICTKCSEAKPISQFCKDRQKSDGLRPACKTCDKIDRDRRRSTPEGNAKHRAWSSNYYNNNKDDVRARVKKLSLIGEAPYQRYKKDPKNKEKIAKSLKDWNERNVERVKEYRISTRLKTNERARNWRKSNPDKYALAKLKRRTAEDSATPSWADIEKIKAIYREASTMEGVHVDHIIPLCSKLVCGLNVHYNLQILPASENQAKGNRYWPDMP